jgi:hypothetical protein
MRRRRLGICRLKPGSKALHEKCFACHQPAKNTNYVFTRYAPTPLAECLEDVSLATRLGQRGGAFVACVPFTLFVRLWDR